MSESRTHKSFLNARVDLTFFVISALLSFFSRKIFLDVLGEDFIGVTSVLTNALGFLNLAELGIGMATAYMLYKPIREQNFDQISAIMSALGYLYRWVGIIILSLGLIFFVFLHVFLDRVDISPFVVLFLYFSLLSSSLLTYFFNYKQILFSADQRNYEITLYYKTASIVKILLQMGCCLLFANYYLWIGIEWCFGILASYLLHWRLKKVYPWLQFYLSEGKQNLKRFPLLLANTKRIFAHRLSGVVLFQLTPILIYAYSSIQDVTKYANYLLITACLSSLVTALYGGTSAAVGNLVAENDTSNTFKLYNELFSLRVMVATFIVTCLWFLTKPFISLWVGSEYLLADSSFILILVNVYILNIRVTTDEFISAFGLFWDVWMPILEASIFIISVFLFAKPYGLNGVLLAGIISQIIVVLGWKPYFLFKWGFKQSLSKYLRVFFQLIAFSLLSITIVFIITSFVNLLNITQSWISWLLSSLIVSITSFTVIIFVFFVFSFSARENIYRVLRYVFVKLRPF